MIADTPREAGERTPGLSADGLSITARCWCERRTIRVPRLDIRAGRTGSCGLDGCVDLRDGRVA